MLVLTAQNVKGLLVISPSKIHRVLHGRFVMGVGSAGTEVRCLKIT